MREIAHKKGEGAHAAGTIGVITPAALRGLMRPHHSLP
jgi:hypothetical protein